MYRVISIPGKLKLSTITDPFTGSWEALAKVQDEVMDLTKSHFFRFARSQTSTIYGAETTPGLLYYSTYKGKLLFPETSSPSSRVS